MHGTFHHSPSMVCPRCRQVSILDEDDFREKSTRDVMDGFARKHLEELLEAQRKGAHGAGNVAGLRMELEWMVAASHEGDEVSSANLQLGHNRWTCHKTALVSWSWMLLATYSIHIR